jgi:hypothetical protein
MPLLPIAILDLILLSFEINPSNWAIGNFDLRE